MGALVGGPPIEDLVEVRDIKLSRLLSVFLGNGQVDRELVKDPGYGFCSVPKISSRFLYPLLCSGALEGSRKQV